MTWLEHLNLVYKWIDEKGANTHVRSQNKVELGCANGVVRPSNGGS